VTLTTPHARYNHTNSISSVMSGGPMPQVPDSYLIESGQLVIHTGNPRVDHAARIANLAAAKANGVKPGPPPTYSPTARLYLSGARKMMLRLPANSVDALVTDPPAGISFMGKQWDTPNGSSLVPEVGDRQRFVSYLTPIFAQALRVCKPGSVALVWALPRTSHWTATALEDAGWVIEDRITHLFGTGFPKGKARLKPACEDWWLCRKPGPLWLGVEECRVGTESIAAHGGGKLGDRIYANGRGIPAIERGTNPHVGRWPPHVVLSHHPECVCRGTKRVKGSNFEGHPDGHKNLIYGSDHRPRPPSGYAGPDGMEEVEDWECHPDCAVRLLDEQSGTKTGKSEGRWPPHVVLSHHPECVYRGTKRVAGNMGVRGSDAGNSMYGGGKGLSRPNTGQQVGYAGSDGMEEVEDWECHPECAVRLLDEQSGPRRSAYPGNPSAAAKCAGRVFPGTNIIYQPGMGKVSGRNFSDSGEASRFFYCAKAPTSEREAGLETLPRRAHGVGNTEAAGRDPANPNDYQADSKRERVSQGLSATQPRANIHPTVKSLSLMRWLIRLACPVRGTVLDPFMGSGTTGCAALLEGRNFVGCDNHYEYFEIANARVSHWSKRS
jgi:DNA modification methylase